jgi:hypothetical protein
MRVKRSPQNREDGLFGKIFLTILLGRGDGYYLPELVIAFAEEPDTWVVITVYAFYFGGNP